MVAEQPAQCRRNGRESVRGKRHASHGRTQEHALGLAHEHGGHVHELVQLAIPAKKDGR